MNETIAGTGKCETDAGSVQQDHEIATQRGSVDEYKLKTKMAVGFVWVGLQFAGWSPWTPRNMGGL